MEFGKILVFVVTVFIGISNTFRIGAFNLKIYGPKKSKDVTVMSYIVKVNNLTLGSSHFNTYLRLKLKVKTCSLFTHNLIFFFWKYYFSLFSLCCLQIMLKLVWMIVNVDVWMIFMLLINMPILGPMIRKIQILYLIS